MELKIKNDIIEPKSKVNYRTLNQNLLYGALNQELTDTTQIWIKVFHSAVFK